MEVFNGKVREELIMQIKKCTLTDTDILSKLNRQLIEDEQSDNSMTLEELEHRMERDRDKVLAEPWVL